MGKNRLYNLLFENYIFLFNIVYKLAPTKKLSLVCYKTFPSLKCNTLCDFEALCCNDSNTNKKQQTKTNKQCIKALFH